MKEYFIEIRLIVYLMLLKITPNLKGYTYFKEVVKRICIDRMKKYQMAELFKEVALSYHEKPSLLDRSLRHAIDVSYKRSGIADFERSMKIGFAGNKPTVRELICVLVEQLTIELNQAFSK